MNVRDAKGNLKKEGESRDRERLLSEHSELGEMLLKRTFKQSEV